MISLDEQYYLDHLPSSVANKRIVIRPYSNKIKDTAVEVISAIRKEYSGLDVRLMGTMGLGISGQNDIDIYALSRKDEFEKYIPGLKKLFGKPENTNPSSITWKLIKNSYEIELYLTDPYTTAMKRQIQVFKTLKNSSTLLKEYEELKQSLNGSTYKDYQTKKYDFYNRILGVSNSKHSI